jgi:hypothetical protein
MCTACGCKDTAVTIEAGVRVAPGQSADVIKGFDVPPPYGKGKE